MAERSEGGETPLRRSRRLGKGARWVQSEQGDGGAAEALSEAGDVEGPGMEILPSVEEGAESLQGGDSAGLLSEPQVCGNEGTVMGEKRKQQDVGSDPCKRPLLGGKEPPADLHSAKEAAIPKGKPKSGRIWKDQKKRFSGMVKDRPLHSSWDKKMKARQEKRMVKDLSKHLKDEKQRAKDEKKQRREENLKRRLENERKGEVVQVIMNPAKIKRAKKKQLRRIEKRDTLALLQGRSVPRKKAMGKAKPVGAAKPKPVGAAKPNAD